MLTNNKGVSTLKENGIVLSDPKDMADGLNRQFESVFRQETPMDLENVPIQEHPTMMEINITNPGIEKLLKTLTSRRLLDQIRLHHECSRSTFSMEICQCCSNL